MAVIRGYMAADVAVATALINGIPEIIVAMIIVVAVVAAWKRVETRAGVAKS